MQVRHTLSHALAVILPDPGETLLLRACLQPGESGRRACESWLREHDDLKNSGTTEFIKSFLPLLFRAVCHHSIEVRNPLLTILKTATLREELRTKTYSEIFRLVLSVLRTNEVAAIFIKGGALGETVYPDPALRHSHDIEILVEDLNLADVAISLAKVGFVSSEKTSPSDCHDLQLVHESGLPLVLHKKLFEIPFYNTALPKICDRARATVLLGVPARVLTPADALLHTCGHAAYSVSRQSYRWISDAWFIVDRHPDLDWDVLLKTARETYLTFPLSVTLTYLAEELGAPVPSKFLHDVVTAACHSDSIDCELALFGARSSRRGGFRNLIREARNWRGQMRILKWMLLPSPAYVRWVSQPQHLGFLPLQYFYRPVRYASRRILPALRT